MTILECEERLAYLGGRRGAVLCARATMGLAGALRALGLPRGSGVLVPVMVCANVAHAIRGAGLRPVLADVEIQRGGIGMSLESGERVVDEGCRVLLAVPLFGGEVDKEGLRGFAERHGLAVVEDAAQRGVLRNHQEAKSAKLHQEGGGLGVCSVVSFGVGKVGDAGGGGAVLGDDIGVLERVRMECGMGRRVDCGRIMGVLDGLEGEIEGRLRCAGEYRGRLGMEGVEHVGEALPVWKYSVLVEDRETRDRVTQRLVERGVEATNLYPPLSVWYRGVDGERYERAWGIWRRIVNLPLRFRRRGAEGAEGHGGYEGMLEVVGEVFGGVT